MTYTSPYLVFGDRVMGKSPFMRATDEATISSITSSSPDFTGKDFTALPTECQDFISSVLTRNPRRRPSAVQCQRHRWLLGSGGAGARKGQGSPLARQGSFGSRQSSSPLTRQGSFGSAPLARQGSIGSPQGKRRSFSSSSEKSKSANSSPTRSPTRKHSAESTPR